LKERSHQIKKVIDYLKLFGEVNRELIDDNVKKISMKKKTRRYKVDPIFVQATEIMEEV